MASGQVLPWIATRDGQPLSPTGLPADGRGFEALVGEALKRFERLLLWDVDGIERGRPQLDLYRRFEGRGLWVDAGVETLDGFIDVLVAGADVGVLNLRTLPRVDDLEEAGELTEKLAVCVEEGKRPLIRDRRHRALTAPDAFRRASQAGIRRGVYIRDTGVQEPPAWAGKLEGMDLFLGPSPEARPWRAVVDVYELM